MDDALREDPQRTGCSPDPPREARRELQPLARARGGAVPPSAQLQLEAAGPGGNAHAPGGPRGALLPRVGVAHAGERSRHRARAQLEPRAVLGAPATGRARELGDVRLRLAPAIQVDDVAGPERFARVVPAREPDAQRARGVAPRPLRETRFAPRGVGDADALALGRSALREATLQDVRAATRPAIDRPVVVAGHVHVAEASAPAGHGAATSPRALVAAGDEDAVAVDARVAARHRPDRPGLAPRGRRQDRFGRDERRAEAPPPGALADHHGGAVVPGERRLRLGDAGRRKRAGRERVAQLEAAGRVSCEDRGQPRHEGRIRRPAGAARLRPPGGQRQDGAPGGRIGGRRAGRRAGEQAGAEDERCEEAANGGGSVGVGVGELRVRA